MTRKRDVVRPYPPDYCDAETLAYRLDISRDAIGERVKQGLLPKPLEILPGKHHWRWADIEAHIAARNGLAPVDTADQTLPPSEDANPFREGITRAKAPHAAN